MKSDFGNPEKRDECAQLQLTTPGLAKQYLPGGREH